MNKGLFSNRGNSRFESGEVVYSVSKPADEFIPLDGTTKKWFERGVDKNFASTMASSGYLAWRTQTSNFGATAITAIAFGNGLWVAGGNSGELRTSTDAVTWVTQTSNFTGQIQSIVYGNNVWVACDNTSTVPNFRTSTDAVTWVTRTSNIITGTYCRTIAYNGQIFVAGGYRGQIRTSTDAITWVTQTSNFGSVNQDVIHSIIYANNTWIAVGEVSLSAAIRTSTDAVTWVTQSFGGSTNGLLSIAYGNRTYVLGGLQSSLYTSTDAVTWVTLTNISLAAAPSEILYKNGIFIVASGSQMFSSIDGKNWKELNTFLNSTINSIANSGNTWLSGADSGQLRLSNRSYIYIPQITYGWIKP